MIEYVRDPELWIRYLVDFPLGAREERVVRHLVMTVVKRLRVELYYDTSKVLVDLDCAEDDRKMPFKHLQIFDGHNLTQIPLKCTSNTITIGEKVVFLAHDSGPMNLVNAFADEIEKVLEKSGQPASTVQ